MKSKEAIATAILVTLAAPEIALAQFSLGSLTDDPGNVSFSSSNLPLQSNFPPLDSAVNLGTDIYNSNSAPDNDPSFLSGDLFEVDDIYQEARDSRPSFLRDVLLGPSENRALHPTTTRVLNILGQAQRGLQTYRLGRSVLDAINNRDSGGIIGGVRNILALYGVLDPNAVVARAAIGTGQALSTIADASSNRTRIQNAALGEAETPDQWYVKAINNDGIAAMAAATGPDIVLGEEGQQQLQAEEEHAAASADAIQVVISDAAQSAIAVREFEQASQQTAESSGEVAEEARRRRSTQAAVKDLNTLASLNIRVQALQASTLAEVNDNSLRQLGGMASIVGMQQVLANKATTMQLMTALNGRQLENVNSGVHRAHNYVVQRDLQEKKTRMNSLQNLVFPRLVTPQQQTITTASNQGGTP